MSSYKYTPNHNSLNCNNSIQTIIAKRVKLDYLANMLLSDLNKTSLTHSKMNA